MNENKFTLSARKAFADMEYVSSSYFEEWWGRSVGKAKLVEGEDFEVDDFERDYLLLSIEAVERLINVSRWRGTDGAKALLARLRGEIVIPPPDADGKFTVPPVREAVVITVANMDGVTKVQFDAGPADDGIDPGAPKDPWAGAADLYDHTKVGQIDQDNANGRRRYQIHRKPGSNNLESPWFHNDDELETWLMVEGMCKLEKWNLSVKLPRTASLVFVDRKRIGGKRIYRYSDGALIKTSDWLLDGEQMDAWLSGFVTAHIDDAPYDFHLEEEDHPPLPPIPDSVRKSWPTAEAIAAETLKDMAAPDDGFIGVVDSLPVPVGSLSKFQTPSTPAEWKHQSSDDIILTMKAITAAREDLEIQRAVAAMSAQFESASTPGAPDAEADSGELIPIDISDAQEPRVNARDLHAFLEIGKHFGSWITDRIDDAEFVEGQDFVVNPNSGKNPQGGRPSKDYLLTMDMAKELSMLERNARGKQARRYFIECEKRLRNMPAAPAFQLPTTFAEALRLAADTTEENERLTHSLGLSRQLLGDASHKIRQTAEDLDVMEGQLAEEERVNADLVALRALEARSILLGEWFQRTFNDHGHGEITGRKVMSCLGLLNRELVAGCKNTKEATIPSALLDARKLIYSHAFLDKMKRIQKDGDVVPVVDADGNAVKIEPRKILITPEYMPKLANWFMSRDETMLRRLTHTRKGEVIDRLKGRYSFYDCDTRAQENLSEEQLFNMVALVKPKDHDPLYRAYCNVREGGKDGNSHVVYGAGKTLELALYDLAEHYLDGPA